MRSIIIGKARELGIGVHDGGTMVVIELALTVVLLAGAGLMVRSFMNLERVELGFPPDGVVTEPVAGVEVLVAASPATML